MPGKTQDREHCYAAPPSQSLESSLQPRPNNDSVEVHPKISASQTKLLNQAVLVLVVRRAPHASLDGFTPQDCAHFCAHRTSKSVIIWGVPVAKGAEEGRGK